MDRTTQLDDVLTRAHSVGDFLKAAAPRIEAANRLPEDVVAALHGARLFRLLLPQSVGGDELDLKTFAEVMQVIASFDASTAWTISQGAGCAMSAAYLGPATAQRLFGPANAVLAWGAGIQGKAIKVNGGYRVSGKWAFASGSGHATLLGGHSFVFEADGTTPATKPDGSRRDRTMLFAADKATFHDVWNVMGLRGTASDTFEVADLFVPEDETLDRNNEAERRESGGLYRCTTSLAYGVGFSALQLGIARAMLDEMRALAMTKTPRAAPSSLRADPVFQTLLAENEAQYRSARAYLHAATSEADAIAATRSTSLPRADRVNLKLATVHVIQKAIEITLAAYRAAGASAIFPSGPFERRFRDAMTASQQVQARSTNYIIAGRCLLDLEPDPAMSL